MSSVECKKLNHVFIIKLFDIQRMELFYSVLQISGDLENECVGHPIAIYDNNTHQITIWVEILHFNNI